MIEVAVMSCHSEGLSGIGVRLSTAISTRCPPRRADIERSARGGQALAIVDGFGSSQVWGSYLRIRRV